MNQQLSTSIDFYLQTDKTNPFFQHLSSNASSKDLINIRNHAFILNKLSLLNLQHPRIGTGTGTGSGGEMFEEQVMELFGVSLQAIINNPAMPYREEQAVRDLVARIQHYHFLMEKLTYDSHGVQSGQALRKKISLNSFWPRLRALLIAIQQKIPQSHQSIKEYVTLRRGMLEPDKKYFVSQMMAKKIETKALKDLIKLYQKDQEPSPQRQIEKDSEYGFQLGQMNTWGQVKKLVRIIGLTNQIQDWRLLKDIFRQHELDLEEEAISYIQDVIGSLPDEELKSTQQIKQERNKLKREIFSMLQKKHHKTQKS